MFKNVGRKIKVLAKVLCGLGILLSVFLAVAIWVTGSVPVTMTESMGNEVHVTVNQIGGAAMGFVMLIGGVLFSWLSNLALYGFGELIDNSAKLVQLKEAENTKVQ